MKNRALFFTILSFVMASFFISSCSKDDDDDDDEENTAVMAKFSMEGTNQEAPADVKFINKSENAVSYSWDFGDGETSTEENPTHTYAEKGEYEVNLVAEGEDGSTDDFGMYFDIFGTVTGLEIRRIELWSDFLDEISDPENDAMDVGIEVIDESGATVIGSLYYIDEFTETGETAYYGDDPQAIWNPLELDGTYTLRVLEYNTESSQGTPTGDEVTISVPDLIPSDGESYPDEISFDNGNLVIDLKWIDE